MPFGSMVAFGDQSSTLPFGAFSSALGVTVPTFSSARASAAVAAAWSRPPSPGTRTGDGPLDTVRVTVDPSLREAPASGSWAVT